MRVCPVVPELYTHPGEGEGYEAAAVIKSRPLVLRLPALEQNEGGQLPAQAAGGDAVLTRCLRLPRHVHLPEHQVIQRVPAQRRHQVIQRLLAASGYLDLLMLIPKRG